MIRDPKDLIRIEFKDDWDLGRDRLIGVLYVPRTLKDVRPLVNLHVEQSMVHPDLRATGFLGFEDPWAEERKKKHEQALQDYPGRFVFPVETIIPRLTIDGKIWRGEDGSLQILYHELHYEAGEWDPRARHTGFIRPQKEGET